MSARTNDWSHKDIWRLFGRDFMVEVSRHEMPARGDPPACFDSEGPHRWCVYAYIYPKHLHFAAFDGTERMLQDAARSLPLHGGPSFCRKHLNADGEVTSYQVGADYNHQHDWRYTQYATKDDARSVFNDAEELFEWLAQGAAA